MRKEKLKERKKERKRALEERERERESLCKLTDTDTHTQFCVSELDLTSIYKSLNLVFFAQKTCW